MSSNATDVSQTEMVEIHSGVCFRNWPHLMIFILSLRIIEKLCVELYRKCTPRQRYCPPSVKNLVAVKGCISDTAVSAWIKEIKSCDGAMDLVLDTPGGDSIATHRFAHFILNYPYEIRTWIPNEAASGGTILAITALSKGKVTMGQYAYLTRVNPMVSYNDVKSQALWRRFTHDVTRSGTADTRCLKEVLKGRLEDRLQIMRMIGNQQHEASTLSIIRRSLEGRVDSKALDVLVRLLLTDDGTATTHGFPLDRRWCLEHGLPISGSWQIPPNIQAALDSAYRFPDE
jgi:hypothetical protein